MPTNKQWLLMGGVAAAVLLLRKKPPVSSSQRVLVAAELEAQTLADGDPAKLAEVKTAQLNRMKTLLQAQKVHGVVGGRVGGLAPFHAQNVPNPMQFAVLLSVDPNLAKVSVPNFDTFKDLVQKVGENPVLTAIAQEKSPDRIMTRGVELLNPGNKRYFGAVCAERVLPIFEGYFKNEPSARVLVEAIKDYAEGQIDEHRLHAYAESMIESLPLPGRGQKWPRQVETAIAALRSAASTNLDTRHALVKEWEDAALAAVTSRMDEAAKYSIHATAYAKAAQQMEKTKAPTRKTFGDLFRSEEGKLAAQQERKLAYQATEEAAVNKALKSGGDDLLEILFKLLRKTI